VAGIIEDGANEANLAVHHSASPEHVSAGFGEGDAHLRVSLKGCVVVHCAIRGEHATVSVVCELIEAEVCYYDKALADLRANLRNGLSQDALSVECLRPERIAVCRNTKKHHAADSGSQRVIDQNRKSLQVVLENARHALDLARRDKAFLHEYRKD
jgi:hypothetical protein